MNRLFEPYFSSCDYSRWKGLKLQIKASKKLLGVKYIFDKLTNEAQKSIKTSPSAVSCSNVESVTTFVI